MSKKIGILFSGGLDSTYLVWKNLTDGNEVIPIYVEIENNQNKSSLEINRVKLLYNLFSKEFGDKIRPLEYLMNVKISLISGGLCFNQVPIWLFGCMYIQGIDIDEIQIGYVMNDDAISYIDDITNIYNSYQPIIDKPMLSLKFPLTKYKKYQLISELPKKYLDLVVSCENPLIIGQIFKDKPIKYEACCSCDSCKKLISSDYYGHGIYKIPKEYKYNVINNSADVLRYYKYKILDEHGNEYSREYSYIESDGKIEKRRRDWSYQLEIDFSETFNEIDVDGYEPMSNNYRL